MLIALVAGAAASMASPHVLARAHPAAVAAQSPRVAAAAERDFAQFVQYSVQQRGGTLPAEFPLDVADVQDLKEARLAYGFPVYTVDPADVLHGRSELRQMARATGEWRFVITLDQRPIGMATLEQVDGRWSVTSYGGAGLAKEVDAAVAAHGNRERSNVRFIRIFQAMSDLLEVQSPVDARTRFAPLNSARQMLVAQRRASKEALLDQADLLEPLRASVRANMEAFR